MARVKGIKFNRMETGEDQDVDYELTDPNGFFSTHANSIPMPSAVQGPRIFYGSRFFEQALPLVNNQAPLVRNMNNESGRSFDFTLGEAMGARRSKDEGLVESITPDEMVLKTATGRKTVDLYNLFPGNRYSLTHNTPMVKVGQQVKPGDLLAKSNYTDDEGRMALGRNARVGLLAYKGHSMDDALVISQSFANKMLSDHAKTVDQEKDDTLTAGLSHYMALFPKKFKEEQLRAIGEDGLVRPGTILQPGDPMILQTRPRTFSSESQGVARLSRSGRFVRKDAAKTWEGSNPAEVLDVARTRDGGVKVFVRYQAPVKPGDKLVIRAGQKTTVSKILPDDHMPRTEDGQPLEVLLNPLGLPSRENASSFYELLLGKIAAKTGKPYTLPSFLPKGQDWWKFVEDELTANGVSPTERIYDPKDDRWLDNPVTVGVAHVLKLHHQAEKKMSARGQAGYCYDELTEVLTRDGWKFWDDVKPEDYLFCPSGANGHGVYARPLELIKNEYDGDMLRYKSTFVDFMVTPEHRMLAGPIKCKKRDTIFREITAGELKGKERWCVPQSGVVSADSLTPEYKIIPGCPPGELCAARHREDLVLSFVDYARLMGWWLAEGSVQIDAPGKRTYIWQSAAANPEKSEEVRALLHRIIGKRPLRHQGKGWRTDDPRLALFLKEYGTRCYIKRIPRDLVHSGREAVMAFLEAFCKGDGNLSEGRDMYTDLSTGLMAHSSSKGMLDDLQHMLFNVGMGSALICYKPKGTPYHFKGRETGVTTVDNWTLNIHRSRTNAQIVGESLKRRNPRYTGSWEVVPTRGFVYCARTVTGWLAVRRNGKILISGNSLDRQPMRGGTDGGGAQRLSGLEMNVLHSSGARGVQKEALLLRGEKCFDDKTEVLTRRGWVAWPEVKESDELYTRAKECDKTAWFEKPLQLVSYDYDGELLGYEGRHLDWLVTPNHKFWGVRGFVSKKKSWRKKQEIKASDLFGKDAAMDSFGAVYPGSIPADHRVIIDATEMAAPTHRAVKEVEMSITDYCRLVGWFGSEGSADFNGGRGNIHISQCRRVNPEPFAEIEELLRRIGFSSVSYCKRGGSSLPSKGSVCLAPQVPYDITGLRVRSMPLAQHLRRECGVGCANKRLPDIVFEAPVASRLELLRCYSEGDGCTRYTGEAKQYYITSTSRQMIEDLQRVALLSGLSAHIGTQKEVDGERPRFRLICGFSIKELTCKKRPAAGFKGHYKESYAGKVYCATTSTGLLYVRRGGKPMWSGNSDDYWRQVRANRAVPDLDKPFVWNKFLALLSGTGVHARDMGHGRLRLAPMTDAELKARGSTAIQNDGIVDLQTMEPKPGGLFDPVLVREQKWGHIDLPFPVVNPSYEETVRQLLGLTEKDYQALLDAPDEVPG